MLQRALLQLPFNDGTLGQKEHSIRVAPPKQAKGTPKRQLQQKAANRGIHNPKMLSAALLESDIKEKYYHSLQQLFIGCSGHVSAISDLKYIYREKKIETLQSV